MSDPKPAVRYCRAANGMPIAWVMWGSGPAIVHCAWGGHFVNWGAIPVFKGYSQFGFGRGRTVVRYDGRGTGLSDRSFEDISIETVVEDLEAVVAAAGLDRFALYAAEGSCHPAIHYAARHPERVTHLILTGGYARGTALRGYPPAEMAKRAAEASALEHGLDDPNPGFRLLNLARLFPAATAAEIAALEEWYRSAFGGRQLLKFQRSVAVSDVSALAAALRCPTLVVHSVGDVRNPLEEGRLLASLIPGARLLLVDSRNYLVLPSEPVFREVMDEIRAFLDDDSAAGGRNPLYCGLTPRQRDVLELLAQGLDNFQIAARLDLSEKTVRNTITPIFEKLGVENRPQAIVKAREAGFGVVSRPRPR